jgi:hypothetical protein
VAPSMSRKKIVYTSNPLAQPLGSPARPSPFLLPPIDKFPHDKEGWEEEFAASDEPPLLVAMSLREQQRKMQQLQKAEEKLARQLDHEVSGRTLRKVMQRSKSSFAVLKKTDLEPLRAEQEERGEKRFLLRFSSEAALLSIKDERATVPWRPTASRVHFPSAESLLLQPPPLPPLLPQLLGEAEAPAEVRVSVRSQVALMVRGYTEAEAYNHVLQKQLHRLRQLRDGTVAAAEAMADEEEEGDDEHEVARKALIMTLRGGAASRPIEHRRIVDMFHLLGCDDNGFVSRSVGLCCTTTPCPCPLPPAPDPRALAIHVTAGCLPLRVAGLTVGPPPAHLLPTSCRAAGALVRAGPVCVRSCSIDRRERG